MADSGLRRDTRWQRTLTPIEWLIAHSKAPIVQAQSEAAVQNPARFSAANRTKVFHVKHFCPIDQKSQPPAGAAKTPSLTPHLP
jgi:hypothetical protein